MAAAIIGVSPGTRSLGVAVSRGNRLLHWQVHSFHGPWSEKKLKYILSTIGRYTERYGAKEVNIKIPDKFPTTKELSINKLYIC